MKLLLVSVVGAAAAVSFAKTVSEPVTLSADADWRGQGVVSLTGAGSLNLGGFNLWTDGITGGDDSLTDATTADASKASSSACFAGSAFVLFDNDFRYGSPYSSSEHRFGANSYPCTIDYDFGEPTCLGGYKIYYNALKDRRFPHTWTFEGSNDKSVWTVVDSHTADRDWTRPGVRLFAFANSTAFRYYRLNISTTDDGVLELYQLEYFKTPAALVDVTEADANKVSSSSTFFSGNAALLFDNDIRYNSDNHRAALYVPFEATYDFGTSVCVNRYRLYYKSLSNNRDRAPGTWTLAGSDDKTTWTVVDSHAGDDNWSFPDVRTFDCSNPGSYRYYKLEVTAPVWGNIMELYQIEYFAGPMVTARPADGCPVADLTTNDATKASSSTLYAGSAAKLFDNQFYYDFSTHRICANSFPVWFAYDFGQATQVNGYKIYFNGMYDWRSPRSWTFEGTDDPSGTWKVLDTRTDITDWTKGQPKSFAFANERKYRHYRLNIAAPNGTERVLELYQLEFGASRGKLHVDVGAGVTQTNRSVAVSGYLDFVKEGAGTFVAAMPQQRSMGDVRVDGGVLRAGLSGSEGVFGPADFGGLSVGPGAVFDIDSFGGWSQYLLTLAGGTLTCLMPSSFAPTNTFGTIRLTADSVLSVRGPLTVDNGSRTGAIDLGGHQLTVDLVSGASLNLSLAEIKDGRLAFTVDGAQAASGVKLASWETQPSFVNTRLVRAKIGDDGLYANIPGFLLMFR